MTMQLSRRGRASKTKTRGPPNKTQIEMKPMERIRIKLDPAEIAGRDSNELPVLTREASSQSRQKVISRTIPTNKIHKWQVRMMLPSPLVTQLLLVAALQLLAHTITSKHQILGCLAQIQQFHQTSSPTAQLHQNSDTGHHAIHHQHPISKRSEMEEFAPEVAASGGGATRPATRDDDELVAANSGLHEEVGESRTAPIKQHNGATQKLHIVRLFAPDSVQNGTQDVTIDCMFKYDKKLDQRLAIKWFFNDEVEPIYQWIPDLNKRVYSDKYERFIDKHYQVNEDVDFMLQAYKWLSAPPAPGQMERDWDHTTGPHQPTTSGGDGSSMGESGRAATAASAAELATGLDASNSILAGRRLKAYHQRHQTPRGTATQLDHLATDMDNLAAAANLATEAADQDEPDEQQVAASRKLLANRLNRLAKLGSDQSRQLLASLRSMLAMDEDEVSKFRALRLVKPTLEMDGRYTCSISSLDGDDLKSARLIVYEPPKSFTFNVSKSAGQMYNLSCQAGPTYPRPSLALYRYRAGQLEAQQQQAPSSAASESWPGRHAHRPRLAATALRQEPLAGTQVQVKISAKRQQQQLQPDSSYEPTILASGHKQMGPMKTIGGDMITMAGSSFPETNKLPRINLDLEEEMAQPAGSGGGVVAGSSPSIVGSYNGHHDQSMAHATNPYEISAWALIDEASLSSNLVTQFECVLTIEGANYEQRQSLALQKGWHVNSAALTAKSTLVGLMSVLASLLCLTVALVSAILIFKLLRRHANKSARVHQQVQATTRKRDSGTRRLEHTGSDRGQSNGACEQNSSSSSASTTPSDDQSATTTTSGRPTGSTIADDENRSITSRGRLTAGGLHGATTGLSSNNQDLSRNSSAQLTLPGPNSSQRNSGGGRKLLATDEANRSQPQASSRHVQPNTSAAVYQHQKLNYSRQTEQEPQQQNHSDGIYRVPETRSSFGTRYMPIGSGQQQQQHQIWSTAYSGLGPGSPIATNCSPFNNHQDYTIDDVYNNQHLLGYYQQQQSGQSLANDRGMSTTNQLAIGDGGGGGLMGNNNANKQHRPQPATISVNGKQLYC